eukprot:207559-Prymnesium_polylepis.1
MAERPSKWSPDAARCSSVSQWRWKHARWTAWPQNWRCSGRAPPSAAGAPPPEDGPPPPPPSLRTLDACAKPMKPIGASSH